MVVMHGHSLMHKATTECAEMFREQGIPMMCAEGFKVSYQIESGDILDELICLSFVH